MIQLIIVLIVIGIILWLVETLIPLDATIRRLIQAVIVICVLLYIIRFFGIF
jgi:hypothetical protein